MAFVLFSLTKWYRRHEYGLRIAICFAVSVLGDSLSELFGEAIKDLDGAGHLRGWSWIFVIEGISTLIFGMGTFEFDARHGLSVDHSSIVLVSSNARLPA